MGVVTLTLTSAANEIVIFLAGKKRVGQLSKVQLKNASNGCYLYPLERGVHEGVTPLFKPFLEVINLLGGARNPKKPFRPCPYYQKETVCNIKMLHVVTLLVHVTALDSQLIQNEKLKVNVLIGNGTNI